MKELIVSETELLEYLRRAVAASGRSQNAWAREHGIDKSYLSRVLRGKSKVYRGLLDAMGFEEVGRRFRKMSPLEVYKKKEER